MASTRPPDGARTTFPVVLALEALERWLAAPSPATEADVAATLVDVAAAAGARGAFLELESGALPALRLGHGTLPTQPGDGRAPRHELRSRHGRVLLGRLWLDDADEAADLAARAMETVLEAAWALATERKAAERMAAFDDATRAIAGVLDLESVLELIVDRVRHLVDARYAALGIVDRFGGIERFITSGVTPDERAAIGPPPRGHGLLGLIIREGRSYRIPDIAAHQASYGFPPNHPPMHAFLGVPVVVKGRALGNLYLTDKRGAAEFDLADQQLVELFARHAGIAIENARLHAQVQDLAVVEERDRIGKELHDGIIQSLYAVTLSLEDVEELVLEQPEEAVERVDRAIDNVHVAIRDIRNFILGLRPHLLEQADLVGGLASLAEELRLNTLIDVELDLEAAAEAAAGLDQERRAQLVQIGREALSNAARHSRATSVRVALSVEHGRLRLVVEDNGRGFDLATPRDRAHQGIDNMRDRAALMGGSLEIESGPETGTRIIVTIPLAAGAPP